MASLEGERWSGNAGVCLVQTRINAVIPTPVPAGICARAVPGQAAIPCAAYQGALTTAGDLQPVHDDVPFNPLTGNTYHVVRTGRRFNDWLPSMNMRYELTQDQIVRFGASRTPGRRNDHLPGAGFGMPVCDAQGCRVTGPNPDINRARPTTWTRRGHGTSHARLWSAWTCSIRASRRMRRPAPARPRP